jgi:hypothetical protein
LRKKAPVCLTKTALRFWFAQGIEVEIPQAPRGGGGIGAESPVFYGAKNAPKFLKKIFVR